MARELDFETRSILDLIANRFFVAKNDFNENENDFWPFDRADHRDERL